MEIRPLLPDMMFRHLEAKDLDGALRAIEITREQGQGQGTQHLLFGMRRFTGYHAPAVGEIHATIAMDAVADFLPAYADGAAGGLLSAAARYLLGLPAFPPRVDLFEPDADAPPPDVVPVSLLEDALFEANLVQSCRVFGRLLSVIRTKEYFLEVLLEAVAPDRTPDGGLLIHANAAVKSLHEMDWESGFGIAYRLLESLSASPIIPGSAVMGMPATVPCRAGYLASLERDRPEVFWIYLAHAFQAARYAQIRPKDVPSGLRAWIADRLFDGDQAAMDAAEDRLGPRAPRASGTILQQPPEDAGRWIAEGIASGSAGAASEAARWARDLPDVDPLYRWIAEGAAPALARGNPRPLLVANAARWGAHLLGLDGAGILTERLLERLAAL